MPTYASNRTGILQEKAGKREVKKGIATSSSGNYAQYFIFLFFPAIFFLLLTFTKIHLFIFSVVCCSEHPKNATANSSPPIRAKILSDIPFLKKHFMRKRIWIHRCMYSRKIIMHLLLMKSIRNFWQKYWLIQRCGHYSIHWRKR